MVGFYGDWGRDLLANKSPGKPAETQHKSAITHRKTHYKMGAFIWCTRTEKFASIHFNKVFCDE